jgi:hypothetical protein
MGNVNFGAPREIIKALRSTFSIPTFIETGTYLGDTAGWASEHFEKVVTIEGLPDFHRQAKERHSHRKNIHFILGDSRVALAEALTWASDEPALFWLDAHWMGNSFGESDECPLLNEIALIHQHSGEHFILIDDARMFLIPPPRPHRATQWPGVAEVIAALHPADQASRFTIVYHDVFLNVPDVARAFVQNYYQDRATEDFEAAQLPSPVSAIPPARMTLPARIKRRLRRMLHKA